MSEWISVKDRLPKACQIVVAWHGYSDLAVTLCEYQKTPPEGIHLSERFRKFGTLNTVEGVTHWMPLPDRPRPNE